jgi:hypothetical protein
MALALEAAALGYDAVVKRQRRDAAASFADFIAGGRLVDHVESL